MYRVYRKKSKNMYLLIISTEFYWINNFGFILLYTNRVYSD